MCSAPNSYHASTAGDYDFFVRNNYLTDQIHFNEAGGEYVGNLLFEASGEISSMKPDSRHISVHLSSPPFSAHAGPCGNPARQPLATPRR